MVRIIEHLSVGSYQEALEAPEEIDALLNVAEEHDLPTTNRAAYKVPLTDMQPILAEQLEEVVRWIKNHIAENHILLFCNAGVGRSPSVAVAYLCCCRGYSFGEAVEHVARRKPDVSTLPDLITRIDQIRGQFQCE